MISIQQNLMDIPQGSAEKSVKQSEHDEVFESVLGSVYLTDASHQLIPQTTKRMDELSRLGLPSDISVPELESLVHPIDLMTRLSVDKEQLTQQIQTVPIRLTQENLPDPTSVGTSPLKKSGLKDLELDGTEIDISMLRFLIPTEKSIGLTLGEIEGGSESVQVNLKDNGSLVSVNLEPINLLPVQTDSNTAVKVDPKVNSAAVLSDLKELKQEETILPLSVTQEVVSNTQTIELMPTAETVSHMMDKSTLSIKPTSSKMTTEVESNNSDKMMDEVPIVSISLKRDPVIQRTSVKASDSDVASKHENVALDQPTVSKPKISNDGAEVAKPTKVENESFESDSEEVKPLVERSANDTIVKPMQSGTASESSEVITEVNTWKSAPLQQLQQAILDSKEGVSPKETKTLTVVLNPEELGAVNVELRSDETGKLHAVLSVEKRETLDVLQQDLHQLKTVLKEIGIDDSSVSLQLSSNSEQGQQKHSEYVAWEEREHLLMRSQQAPVKAIVEKATYPERHSTRRLDIKA